uniref:Uncharacterized protein n=1 Tax=Anguilla anguilla TaxID=7936 RepID=A0A0E9SY80_ANGAN
METLIKMLYLKHFERPWKLGSFSNWLQITITDLAQSKSLCFQDC